MVDREQSVDVEHPGGDNGRVARPSRYPVAPPDEIAGEVPELVARVRVNAPVAVGHSLCQLAEQHAEEDGARTDDTEDDKRHRAGQGEYRRHREHTGADDAADDEPGG